MAMIKLTSQSSHVEGGLIQAALYKTSKGLDHGSSPMTMTHDILDSGLIP